ncbi:hypothetical protein VW23_014390 [Devosia insulae DS-56]|uniref:Uncharacterized protein n=1 Tax=Devosia insulae DS-56 TaxID=1116389 RepID=A0A1E5XTE8_9HYPH|nr:hypothetical protein VW23_014390 [Devosia insulae DS-56]
MSLVDGFIDDVRIFFQRIGVNEDVEIVVLDSGVRQQNLKAYARGILWTFRQEANEQDLEFGTLQPNSPSISVNDIGWYFRPPSSHEIRQIAKSERFLISYDGLADMAPFVRENLDSIVNLVSSSRFPEAVTLVRDVKRRVFDAI